MIIPLYNGRSYTPIIIPSTTQSSYESQSTNNQEYNVIGNICIGFFLILVITIIIIAAKIYIDILKGIK